MKNTMMKPIFYVLVILTMLVSTRCKKDEPVPATNVTIEFVDGVTGAPVGDVFYNLNLYNPSTGNSFTLDSKTGQDGKLSLEITDGSIPTNFNAYREGYDTGFDFNIAINVVTGQDNRFEVPMYRYNCTVRLDLKNNTAEPDSVFVRLWNGVLLGSGGLAFRQFPYNGPFALLPFETQTYYIPAVSNDPVSIFWSWNSSEWSDNLPLKKVEILAESDTLNYTISN